MPATFFPYWDQDSTIYQGFKSISFIKLYQNIINKTYKFKFINQYYFSSCIKISKTEHTISSLQINIIYYVISKYQKQNIQFQYFFNFIDGKCGYFFTISDNILYTDFDELSICEA